MLSAQEYERLRSVDIVKADKASLVDITTIEIDPLLPIEARTSQFISSIKNPYAFRVGEYGVKLTYSPNGISIHEALANYLATLRAGY